MDLELLRALILISNTCFYKIPAMSVLCENFVASYLANGNQISGPASKGA